MHSRLHVAAFGAIAALGALAPSPARADTVGVVTLEVGQTPVQRADVAEAVTVAVAGQRHTVVSDPVAAARERTASGAVLADRLAPFARAREYIAEGWSRYVRFQLPGATEQLELARKSALAVADLDLGVALVAETSLRLGVIKFENGDLAGSTLDFRLSYRLAPARAVTNNEFKPAVVAAFAAAVAQPTVRRAVEVSVDPDDAALEVDGIETVVTGGTLDLEVGLHLVVVRGRSMAPSRELFAVPSGGTARIAATLTTEPATAGLFAGELVTGVEMATAGSIVDATLVFAELDSLLMTATVWRGESPTLLGQSCTGSPARCSRVFEIRFDDANGLPAAASELVRRISTETERAEPPTLPQDRRLPESKKPVIRVPPPPPEPWWKNKWVWIGGGAALGVTGVGSYFLIRSLEADPRTVIEVDACQFGRC